MPVSELSGGEDHQQRLAERLGNANVSRALTGRPLFDNNIKNRLDVSPPAGDNRGYRSGKYEPHILVRRGGSVLCLPFMADLPGKNKTEDGRRTPLFLTLGFLNSPGTITT